MMKLGKAFLLLWLLLGVAACKSPSAQETGDIPWELLRGGDDAQAMEALLKKADAYHAKGDFDNESIALFCTAQVYLQQLDSLGMQGVLVKMETLAKAHPDLPNVVYSYLTVKQTLHAILFQETGREEERDLMLSEGAKAIGMNHFQTMLYVILPQALRNIMPQIGNNFIINVKDTSVMFIIGFPDFFAAHRAAVGASYLYFPSATVEMIGYLTMTLLASFLLRRAEKKMDGSGSYELVQEDQLVMTAGTYRHPKNGSPFDERSREYQEEEQGKEN